MKDFIHKSLLSAGSKDAVTNMMQGAGVGAVANVGLGAVQGDFDVIGNATSGALLGAGGGAAARHFGSKYASGMHAMGEKAPNTLSTTVFTKANKAEDDFWGNNTDLLQRNQEMYDKYIGALSKKPAGTPTQQPTQTTQQPTQPPTQPPTPTQATQAPQPTQQAPQPTPPTQVAQQTTNSPIDYTKHEGFGSLGKAHQEVLKKYPNEVPTEKPDGMSAAAFRNLISTHRNAVSKLGKYKE